MQSMEWNARAALAIAASLTLVACGGGGTEPAPVAAASPATTAAPAAATAQASWIVPAALPGFDLSRWKLTLPVDAYGGTGGIGGTQFPAVTLSPQQLVAGYASAWFQGDAQGRIVFTAPANGAVTTPGSGSDHTRSELREFATGANANADGYWTGGGTLASECAVQAAASLAKTIIIGQLRSAQHQFALMVYRPGTREVAVDVYARDVDGSAHALTTLLTGVDLGTPVAYTLDFRGGTLTASANGTTRTFAADASWSSAALAFKVGAYHTASNTGNPPGDATVVACSRFAVTH